MYVYILLWRSLANHLCSQNQNFRNIGRETKSKKKHHHSRLQFFGAKTLKVGRGGSWSTKDQVYMWFFIHLFVFTLQVQYKLYSTGFFRGVALGVEFEIGKGGHLRPLAATCRKRPLAATCGHLTEAATCGHLRPLALCGHLRSLAATCGHWAGLVGHLLQRPLAASRVAASGCKWPRITKYIVPDHVPSGRWPLEFVVTEKVGDFPGKVMENVGHFPRGRTAKISMEREFCDIEANQPVSQ